VAGVEPREPEVVLAVEVGMLAPRVPPAALVVGRAVGRRAVVLVAVRRAEPPPVLVGQRVGRVAAGAAVTGHGQPVTVVRVRHGETLVHGQPPVAVDVGHVHAQRRRRVLVRRQPVHGFVAQPKVRSACEQRKPPRG